MSARRRGTGHRLPALLAILVVVAGLVAVSRAGHPFHPTVRGGSTPVSGPTVAPADAVSSTWYCAEGTSNEGGRADETVIIANLNPAPITATVTVLSGGRAVATRRERVEALGQRRVTLSSIRAATEPGVIVGALEGGVAVEHELARGSDSTVGPCARQASRSWYFAAGDTSAGMEDWLALFNPFADDAIVDLTFLTPEGVQSPLAGQAIVVPRQSRVSVPLQQVLGNQSELAVLAHARLGRVVAEQSLYSDGSSEPAGLTTALGATGAAPRWRVPSVDGGSGATATLELANFSSASTHVTVGYTLDNDAVLRSQRVSVPSLTVTSVDLSQRVAAGTGYSVRVQAPARTPVVAELLQTWAAPASPTGLATTLASTAVASRWVFATGRTEASGDAQLAAVNVAGHTITVRLRAYAAGDPNPITSPAQSVRAGQRAVFSLSSAGVASDQLVVLDARGLIVAGREVLGPSRSLSVGMPELP